MSNDRDMMRTYPPDHPFGPMRKCPFRTCLNTYTPRDVCPVCGSATVPLDARRRPGPTETKGGGR